MTWLPLNLSDALGTAGDPNLPMREVVRDRDGNIIKVLHDLYQCPTCSKWHRAVMIVDTRTLPITEDWACDGCWSDWHRHARVIDGGLAIALDRKGRNGPRNLGRKEWLRRWVTALGAPQEVLDKIALRRRD